MPGAKYYKGSSSLKDRQFGRRKYIHVPMSRNFGLGKNKNAGSKQWVHPPETLCRGHIVYNVKFLGHVEVDQPKGTEVVKDAIRKMKFNKQIRKAEGQKPPKVELTISIDGVTIQEPKYKVIQHQYPLHRISYCADDKSDKRMFTFIAKEAETTQHFCYVFDSDKCAEEITLTIGQAFDLAYKRFLETSGKDMDQKKQYLLLQKKVQQLTQENLELKARVADLERMIDPQILENFDRQRKREGTVSPSKPQENPVVGRKLENLILEDAPTTNGTSAIYAVPDKQTPQSQPAGMPRLAPPPPVPTRNNIPQQQVTSPTQGDVDLFGAPPFTPPQPSQALPQVPPPQPVQKQQPHVNPFGGPPPAQGGAGDPFGMGNFNPATTQEIDKQIQGLDKELMDLQAGFSQGLSFGTEDFSLDDLDPLKK
jgi:hypothetical protein